MPNQEKDDVYTPSTSSASPSRNTTRMQASYEARRTGATPELTWRQRAYANRWAAQAFVMRGITNAGFRAVAGQYEGVNPTPLFQSLPTSELSRLSVAGRAALVNAVLYSGVNQAAIGKLTGNPNARGTLTPGNRGVILGTQPNPSTLGHETAHLFDFRFGNPSQQAGFVGAVANVPDYRNFLSIGNPWALTTQGQATGYRGAGEHSSARELYANVVTPGRVSPYGSVYPSLQQYYPQYQW